MQGPQPRAAKLIYRHRKPDHHKSEKNQDLTTDFEAKLEPYRQGQFYGNRFILFPLYRDKNKQHKIKYMTLHNEVEYFALEILLKIGFVTPKARLSYRRECRHPDGVFDYALKTMVTNALTNYIPMIAVRHDIPLEIAASPNVIRPIREQYEIDITRQIILDHKERKAYRISGNLFSADIAGILIGDEDLQPEDCHLGLVKIGNRFLTAAIDKEKVSLTGSVPPKNYEEMLQRADKRITTSLLFSTREKEQVMAILYQIHCACESKEEGFDAIFDNPRVRRTALLAKIAETCQGNLKHAAKLMLERFSKVFGQAFQAEFAVREDLRHKIVDNIFEKHAEIFSESSEADKLIIRANIIDDLKGPYYTSLFLNQAMITVADLDNGRLMAEMVNDIKDELRGDLSQKYDHIMAERPPQQLLKRLRIN
jgi:hypothetical protein